MRGVDEDLVGRDEDGLVSCIQSFSMMGNVCFYPFSDVL